jgi:hypothetical protein
MKSFQKGFSFSPFFKRGLIITTTTSFTLVLIVAFLLAYFPSLGFVYNSVVGILILSQIGFIYYSIWNFRKLMHQPERTTENTRVVGMSEKYIQFLVVITRCLFVEASALLTVIILLIVFTFFSSNGIMYLVLHSFLRLGEFITVISVLYAISLKKVASPKSGVSNGITPVSKNVETSKNPEDQSHGEVEEIKIGMEDRGDIEIMKRISTSNSNGTEKRNKSQL